MDPADTQEWRAKIEGVLAQQENRLNDIARRMQQLTQQLSEVIQAKPAQSEPSPAPLVPSAPVATPGPEPLVAPPARYGGEPADCRAFLVQCELQFELQPSCFPTERSRVAYVISLLTGRARLWGTAEWERDSEICNTFKSFSDKLQQVFDPNSSERAARVLSSLTQARRSVSDYAIDFRTAAADSSWNPDALYGAFYRGLSETVKDALAARDLPETLEDLIDLATGIDWRMRERLREKSRIGSSSWPSRPRAVTSPAFSRPLPETRKAHTGPVHESEEPVQTGRSRLSATERERRFQNKLCLYCGNPGHRVQSCPLKGRTPQE